jgi:hypothetical protein
VFPAGMLAVTLQLPGLLEYSVWCQPEIGLHTSLLTVGSELVPWICASLYGPQEPLAAWVVQAALGLWAGGLGARLVGVGVGLGLGVGGVRIGVVGLGVGDGVCARPGLGLCARCRLRLCARCGLGLCVVWALGLWSLDRAAAEGAMLP